MKLAFRKLGGGAPLLILHGLFGSSDNWQTLGARFANYFTVYLIDLRNHGRSPHAEEFDYDSIAGDIKELCQSEGIGKAMLLGHSLGGKAAMHFSLVNREKVERLVVADIGTKSYPAANEQVVDALGRVNLEIIKTRKEAEDVLRTYIDEEPVRQFLLKNLYWTDENKLAWRFNLGAIKRNIGMAGAATMAQAVPSQLPALFIRGENSHYILPEDFEGIRSIFPCARLEVIPRAGHWVHADQPQLFYETVIAFLRPKP